MSTHYNTGTSRHGSGGIRVRDTHGTGAGTFPPEVEGIAFHEWRDGEQSQQGDIAPEAINGAVHIQPGSIEMPLFAAGIVPPRVVAALPSLPAVAYPIGSLVFLTTDGKLYRNVANAWTVAVDGTDIVANSITAGQIAAGAIGADELAANSVIAAKINAGAVTTDKIAAGSVSAAKITAGGLGGRNMVTNSGFELGGFGVLAGWGKSGAAVAVDGVAETGRATTFPFEGRRSLRFAAAVYNYAFPSVGFIFQADRWYTASFWISDKGTAYAPTGSGAGIIFESLDGHVKNGLIYLEDGTSQASSLPFRLLFNASIDASWRRYSVTWQQLDTFEGNFLITNAYGGGAVPSGELFFDGIQVEEGAIATSYTPGPMDVRNLTGEVAIDSTGVTITNGKLTVSNPGATVIIDGTSNMFKILATGTMSIANGPNGSGGTTEIITSVTLALGLAYVPAFLGFLESAINTAIVGNWMDWVRTTGFTDSYGVWEQMACYVNRNGTDTKPVALWRVSDLYNQSAKSAVFRYYVLKEASI